MTYRELLQSIGQITPEFLESDLITDDDGAAVNFTEYYEATVAIYKINPYKYEKNYLNKQTNKLEAYPYPDSPFPVYEPKIYKV